MSQADRHALELIEFCSEFGSAKLDPCVLDAAKRHLTDLVGVALAGSGIDSSRIAREYAEEQGGVPEASVMGSPGKPLPAVNACFCNGVSAHALELDDVHTRSSLHPGVVVVPAALATCQREGADGATMLRAIILGYEVMTRMGMAADPKAHYARGFHPTSTCGCFGATAAAGHVLGLNLTEFTNAFGIAASMASGLLEFSYSGSWVKRFHTGWAAHSGVTAAIMAKKGFTGPPTAITGPYGFLKSYSSVSHPELLSADLGKTYEVCDTQIKYFACCTYQHAALTGIVKHVAERGIDPKRAVRVDVGVVEPAIRLTYEPREAKIAPSSIVDAQFSLPFGVAVSMLFGKASIDEYTEELLKDDRVLEIASKVYVHHSPGLEQYYPKYFPAEIEVQLDGGETVTATVLAPKGHPENPLTQTELEERFLSLTRGVLGEDKGTALLGSLRHIEDLNDTRRLGPLLEK